MAPAADSKEIAKETHRDGPNKKSENVLSKSTENLSSDRGVDLSARGTDREMAIRSEY